MSEVRVPTTMYAYSNTFPIQNIFPLGTDDQFSALAHSLWANFEFHVHFGFFEVAAIFFNQCIVLDLLNRNPFVGRRQRCPKLSFRRFFSFTV